MTEEEAKRAAQNGGGGGGTGWAGAEHMATPDEIRESQLGNRAKSIGCCLRRSPATDVGAADYGCFLVYETLDCSGGRAVSKTSTKLRTSL